MKSLVTIGTFDGVHRGHRELIKRLLALAKKHRLASHAVLFDRPPRQYFHPEETLPLLTLPAERAAILRELGVQKTTILNFTGKVAGLSHIDFFERFILRDWKAGGLYVGPDFAFGKGRAGDIPWLKEICRERKLFFAVQSIKKSAGQKISSSAIRRLVSEGEVARAGLLLGRSYAITGKVVRGDGLGRKLGFPTANLEISPLKLAPRGVYDVRVSGVGRTGDAHIGVCNIGMRPTIHQDSRVQIEVHLPGFEGNLYGKSLTVEFIRRLRREKKFPSVEALKAQIHKDIQSVV